MSDCRTRLAATPWPPPSTRFTPGSARSPTSPPASPVGVPPWPVWSTMWAGWCRSASVPAGCRPVGAFQPRPAPSGARRSTCCTPAPTPSTAGRHDPISESWSRRGTHWPRPSTARSPPLDAMTRPSWSHRSTPPSGYGWCPTGYGRSVSTPCSPRDNGSLTPRGAACTRTRAAEDDCGAWPTWPRATPARGRSGSGAGAARVRWTGDALQAGVDLFTLTPVEHASPALAGRRGLLDSEVEALHSWYLGLGDAVAAATLPPPPSAGDDEGAGHDSLWLRYLGGSGPQWEVPHRLAIAWTGEHLQILRGRQPRLAQAAAELARGGTNRSPAAQYSVTPRISS